MVRITFVEFGGARREVSVRAGASIMRAAVDNQIRGIDGDCGGQCGCATCHVFVEPAWLSRLRPKSDAEAGMLDLAESTQTNSRLGCQIALDDALDGLVVHIPQGQH